VAWVGGIGGSNAKMLPVETVLGHGGRGEFKYDIFDTL
jgi:hypothetical protein